MNRLKNNLSILLIILWQVVSVYLMAVGIWPKEVAYVNTGLIALYFLISAPLDSLRLFILSMPFYVVIPNQYSDTLSMWRPLLVWLALVVLAKQWSVVSGLPDVALAESGQWSAKKLSTILKKPDFYFAIFIALTLISTFIARYPIETVKQIVFLLNAYLIYIVIRFTVKNKEQVVALTKSVLISLGMIVALGFVQFLSTFFTSSYYFWQYWATMVSSLYYGQSLSDVLIYSNSWFSYTGGASSLRMFSIMPDSHSFALVCALAFLLALPFVERKHKPRPRFLSALEQSGRFSWTLAVASGLGVVLAGTRGVWVGMLVPFAAAIVLYAKKFFLPLSKKIVTAFILILLFFAASPFINQGINLVRSGTLFGGGFLDRAQSIYDLSEQSNVGRLKIWRESARYALTHPLGTGYGNFIVSLHPDMDNSVSYQELAQINDDRFNLPEKFVTAHSLYLHLLVEVGLLGLLAFLFWPGAFLYSAAGYLWQKKNEFGFEQELVLAISLFLIWLLAHGIFDLTVFNDKILLYVFSVLAIAGIIKRERPSRN